MKIYHGRGMQCAFCFQTLFVESNVNIPRDLDELQSGRTRVYHGNNPRCPFSDKRFSTELPTSPAQEI
jgi:hypothetical protein